MLSSVNIGDQIMDQGGGPIGTVTATTTNVNYSPGQALCDVIVSGNPNNVRHGVVFTLARSVLILAAG